MKNKTNTGFFTDAQGSKSSTRLKTFLAAVTAFVIALGSVFISGISVLESLPVIIVLLAYSAGEKSYQNYLESRFSNHNNPSS